VQAVVVKQLEVRVCDDVTVHDLVRLSAHLW